MCLLPQCKLLNGGLLLVSLCHDHYREYTVVEMIIIRVCTAVTAWLSLQIPARYITNFENLTNFVTSV